MGELVDIQNKAAKLSSEQKVELISYLLDDLPETPIGADDEEVLRREEEMNSGIVQPISHEEFLKQVGRS